MFKFCLAVVVVVVVVVVAGTVLICARLVFSFYYALMLDWIESHFVSNNNTNNKNNKNHRQ